MGGLLVQLGANRLICGNMHSLVTYFMKLYFWKLGIVTLAFGAFITSATPPQRKTLFTHLTTDALLI